MSGGHAEAGGKNEVVLYWDDLNDAARWTKTFEPMVKKLNENGQLVTFYIASEPYYPNTYLYSTLRESRLLAWIADRTADRRPGSAPPRPLPPGRRGPQSHASPRHCTHS